MGTAALEARMPRTGGIRKGGDRPLHSPAGRSLPECSGSRGSRFLSAFRRDAQISCLPSRARTRVAWSAYSRWLPTGIP